MNLKKLSKKEIKSLYEGLDHLVYFVLDNTWDFEDKQNLEKLHKLLLKEKKNDYSK